MLGQIQNALLLAFANFEKETISFINKQHHNFMTLHAFLSTLFFLQAPTTTTTPKTEESQSLIDIIMGSSTSGLIVIFILLGLSLIAVYIIVERYFTLTHARPG